MPVQEHDPQGGQAPLPRGVWGTAGDSGTQSSGWGLPLGHIAGGSSVGLGFGVSGSAWLRFCGKAGCHRWLYGKHESSILL